MCQYSVGFEPEENIVEDISRLVQEPGLDKVTAEDVTNLLDRHGQQPSNQCLEELAEELSHRRREKC